MRPSLHGGHMLAAPDAGRQQPRYNLQVYGRKTDEDEEKPAAAPAAAAGNGSGVPAQVSPITLLRLGCHLLLVRCSCDRHGEHAWECLLLLGWGELHAPGAELHLKTCRPQKRRRMSWTLSFQYEDNAHRISTSRDGLLALSDPF